MIRDETANLLLSYGRENLSDEEFDKRWRELKGKYINTFTKLCKFICKNLLKPVNTRPSKKIERKIIL